METSFVKGHGTENDFVLLPDANGRLDLSEDQVRFLCDRRAGIGGDGVIRVVRTDATDDPAAVEQRPFAEWFMDYRNADGSLSEMCGNGVRVLALYLATHADVDPRDPLRIATRAGLRTIRFEGSEITVDMGGATVREETTIGVRAEERSWPATHVETGNPHAVVLVEDLADAGDLREPPAYDAVAYPAGVNVEFVVRRGEHRVALRVHERGSGETRSCGTGACAAVVAVAHADQTPRGAEYTVDVPGGTLRVTWTEDDQLLLTGPAVLVAEGLVDLPG